MKLINSDNDNSKKQVVINDPEQFLKFFTLKENATSLVQFLNAMLENKGDNAIERVVEILDSCEDFQIAAKRKSVLDLLCKEKGGDYSIVQVVIAKAIQSDQKEFQQEIVEYVCGAYLMEAQPGGKYANVSKVQCLALLDFIVYPENPDATFNVTMNVTTPDGKALKPFTITCKELPKFGNLPENAAKTIIKV